MKKRVYVVSALRTPVGSMGGGLAKIFPVDMGRLLIKEIISQTGISSDIIDEIYLGCVLQAGHGQNIARQIALKSGLPNSVVATTLNVLCGSGLHSINTAAKLISYGEIDVAFAGGVENMSQAPYLVTQGRYGYRLGDGVLTDSMIKDGLTDSFEDYHMGVTAENVAKKQSISRSDMDSFADQSHKKALSSQKKLREEIVPIELHQKKGTKVIDTDECVRENSSVDTLNKMKPAFLEHGTVTAGNSSPISDGGAMVLLMSEDKINELGIKPLVEWLGGELVGTEPETMGMGPVFSTRKLLKKAGYGIEDIDVFEVNEAFAAQAIASQRELKIPDEKLNPNGGAIALGHPLGASGCRIIVTLIHEMIRNKQKFGLASLCIGGGMGCSTLVSYKER